MVEMNVFDLAEILNSRRDRFNRILVLVQRLKIYIEISRVSHWYDVINGNEVLVRSLETIFFSKNGR